MKGSIAGIVAAAAMAGAGWNSESLKSASAIPAGLSGLNVHESHAAASLLGQFRTSASTWLWLKTDLYLHNGVEMRILTDDEVRRGEQAIRDGDGWHSAIGDHAQLTTTVPSAERDFRGVLGEIERQTSPYGSMEGHIHTEARSTLPLFRLMTWLDPTFIPGWTTGSMLIASERGDEGYARAVSYLLEGLASNPDSIALRIDLARLMISRKQMLAESIPILEAGTKLAEDRWDSLNEDDKESVLDGFRWLALCHAQLGQTGDSMRSAARGLKFFDNDEVLLRQSRPEPCLLVPLKGNSSATAQDSSVDSKHDGHDGHSH